MTALEPEPLVAWSQTPGEVPVRLWVDEGVLCASCRDCDVYLEQALGAAEADARRAFLAAHPPAGGSPHVVRVPSGWFQPLSGPGAFSQ